MIIYNVALKVENDVAAEWKEWMLNTHIPEMMGTKLFNGHKFCHLLDQDESSGVTFVVQYFCEQRADYDKYIEVYATGMRKKGVDRFGNKALAYRTIMEIIE